MVVFDVTSKGLPRPQRLIALVAEGIVVLLPIVFARVLVSVDLRLAVTGLNGQGRRGFIGAGCLRALQYNNILAQWDPRSQDKIR